MYRWKNARSWDFFVWNRDVIWNKLLTKSAIAPNPLYLCPWHTTLAPVIKNGFNLFSYLSPKLSMETKENWAQFLKINCFKNCSVENKVILLNGSFSTKNIWMNKDSSDFWRINMTLNKEFAIVDDFLKDKKRHQGHFWSI